MQSGAIHCCQSNEPRCPNGCRGSLFVRMSARTTAGLSEPLLNYPRNPIHSVKLRFTSFSLYTQFLPLLHIVQSGAIHCCQSNGAGYPKGCPAPLFFCISEHKSFCARRKKLLGSIIGGANYPKGAYGADWRKPTKPTRAKDVRLLLFTGVRALWIGHEVENFQGEHRFRHKTTSNT